MRAAIPLRAEPFAMTADLAEDRAIEVTLLLTTDPGPMREFRPFLTVPLDRAHATELVGTLLIALDRLTLVEAGAADETELLLTILADNDRDLGRREDL